MSNLLFPQDTIGVTPESWDIILIADVSDSNNPKDCTLAELPVSTATQKAINAKQDTLVSATNIKTVNSTSLLGSGNITTWDVVWPASATDNAIVRFDTTTGKLLQNSWVTIWDTNIVSWISTLNTQALNASSQIGANYDAVDSILLTWWLTFAWGTYCRINDGSSNELIKFPTTPVASAVNEFTITNAATGTWPTISATGGDTNIDFNIVTKWSGVLKVNWSTAWVWDALTTNPLSQFASTTSLQLKWVISDETGSGSLVFANSPDLTTPDINSATVDSLTAWTASAWVLIKNNSWVSVATFWVWSAWSTNIALIWATVVTWNVSATNLSGTNTGDQTITLTGAVTGSWTWSFATTIATPGTLTVSSTNSTATAHTHAVTSSSAPWASASILATDASGHIGSTGTRIVKWWFTDVTATNAISWSITGNAATVTTNANLTWHITSTGNATVLGSFTMAQLDTAVSDGNVVYQSQALWTPTSGTLSNCTGLPVAWITASTSTALGVGSIELWHATDTSITRVSAGVISVEGVTVPTISSTSTLTNKRITKRVVTTTDDATAVIDTDITDEYELSAMANATTFTVTGTPTDWQTLLIRLKDNGSARALTWTMSGGVIGVTLPTTTVISKWSIIGFKYFSSTTSWKAIAVANEA